MQEIGFLSVREVAKILCTTPNAIYIAICEGRSGDTIPPASKLVVGDSLRNRSSPTGLEI